MVTKHGKVVTYGGEFLLLNSHNPLNMWSRDKLKTLFLHYCNAFGHQTYQGGESPQEVPNQKLAWLCEKLNTLHSLCKGPMDKKLGEVLTYREKLPPLKPHDPFIT